METNLEPRTSTLATTTNHTNDVVSRNNDNYYDDDDDDDYIIDSNCSTPYVSAPSSPRHRTTTATFLSPPHPPPPAGFFFYSAPTSPVHYVLTSSARNTGALPVHDASSSGSFEFEFSSRFDSPVAPETGAAMSSADELFLNGQIRPMKLCAHLNRPQHLPPFATKIDDIIEDDEEDDDDIDNDVVFNRSRDLKLRDRSQRRRTRSMSPLRSTTPFDWLLTTDDDTAVTPSPKAADTTDTSEKDEVKEIPSASSSRCSSAGRSSKRWVFLKDFLRSKSEGTGRSNNKFWHNINMSFSTTKEKEKEKEKEKKPVASKKAVAGKRRSAHEMHYAAKRAQAEEMKKKTFLPYRQGLLGGCLGFNSKSYTALNGFVRGLNPVSST